MTDKHSEQIFDYFLEEMLTQQRPPDLTARIQAAWIARQSLTANSEEEPGRELIAAELVQTPPAAPAPQGAIAPTQPRPLPASPAATAPTAHTVTAARSLTNHQTRNRIALVLALAACGLLALLAWQLPSGWNANFIASDTPPREAAAPGGLATSQSPAIEQPSSVALSPAAPQVLDIDDLPFAVAQASPPTETSRETTTPTAEPLPASQIVSHMDQRLSDAWRDHDVTPAARLPEAERAQKIAQRLTGLAISESNATQSVDLTALIAEATDSLAFARHWSQRFTEQWLARASLEISDPRVEQLQQEVAAHIQAGRAWNAIVPQLLGGDLSQPGSSTTFVSALAGNGNHRLLNRIGASFLNTNLSCVRCHDASSGGNASLVESQQAYWSLVGLLQGVDAIGNASRQQRVIVDRQAELLAKGTPQTIYFDLLDGRLQAAEPQLPSGENWQRIESASVPRQALAEWISQSPLLDQATVNFVWQSVFDRPLVPQVEGGQELAIEQRRQLLSFLANQFRAHDRDLKLLVGWLVQSDAFARQSPPVSHSQWLAASATQLDAWQRAEQLFAAGSTLTEPRREPSTLEGALVSILDWRGHRGAGSATVDEVTLAQPRPAAAAAGKTPRNGLPEQAELSGLQLAYTLHANRPTAAQRAFVDRLLQSKRLSWEQCVEHVVGLNPIYAANGRIQQLASQLLQTHNGDARAALLELLWVVQHSPA